MDLFPDPDDRPLSSQPWSARDKESIRAARASRFTARAALLAEQRANTPPAPKTPRIKKSKAVKKPPKVRPVLPAPVVRKVWAPRPPKLTFTARERLVSMLHADGMTAGEVAPVLGRGEGTVREVIEYVRRKYRLAGRDASTKFALRARMVEDGVLPDV